MDRNKSPTAAFALRKILLPQGRILVVRAVSSADVDGLAELYDGLDFDDRYRRFFSAYRPPRTFFEHLGTAADGGGFGIVAVSKGTDDDDAIVAEANYSLLPDGDGELAVTVASSWRGWLAPYLLDALLEAAAARGVANLQADVLVSNSAMLALIRSRGYATMDLPDWTYVRVIIGTAGRTPVWPGPHDRPRVLVEVPGGRWPTEAAARKVGLRVLACPGPSVRGTPCPALAACARSWPAPTQSSSRVGIEEMPPLLVVG